MDGLCDSSSSSTSSFGSSSVVPPVSPKSPPSCGIDLYGKRRQLVKVQVLEREITLLQEELKLIENLQPASRCCKEVDNFIGAKPDPFIALYQKAHKSRRFWRKLWRKCSIFSWICCCGWCIPCLKLPKCCTCCHLSASRCHFCGCLKNFTCRKRCKIPFPFCSSCSLYCFN